MIKLEPCQKARRTKDFRRLIVSLGHTIWHSERDSVGSIEGRKIVCGNCSGHWFLPDYGAAPQVWSCATHQVARERACRRS